jgi:hypothetical protein
VTPFSREEGEYEDVLGGEAEGVDAPREASGELDEGEDIPAKLEEFQREAGELTVPKTCPIKAQHESVFNYCST